jgi:AcrR family transcriptional regulator
MSRNYESPSRKAHAEATRLAILRALVDLIVDEGPGTISIPQVAARAGVSVRTVYHYFPTKEALFDGLTESIRDLVSTPDGGPPGLARSPRELAAAMAGVYRYFEANARMFRALAVSELGGRVSQSRLPERRGRMDAALEPLEEHLDADELRKLRGAVGVLTSFNGYEALTDVWGLSRDEAADVAAWVVRTLCDRARRSGVAR